MDSKISAWANEKLGKSKREAGFREQGWSKNSVLDLPNSWCSLYIQIDISVDHWKHVCNWKRGSFESKFFGDIGIGDIEIIYSCVPGQIECRLGMDKEEHKWNLGYIKSFEFALEAKGSEVFQEK